MTCRGSTTNGFSSSLVKDEYRSTHGCSDGRRHQCRPEYNHKLRHPWSEKRSTDTAAACSTNNTHPYLCQGSIYAHLIDTSLYLDVLAIDTP